MRFPLSGTSTSLHEQTKTHLLELLLLIPTCPQPTEVMESVFQRDCKKTQGKGKLTNGGSGSPARRRKWGTPSTVVFMIFSWMVGTRGLLQFPLQLPGCLKYVLIAYMPWAKFSSELPLDEDSSTLFRWWESLCEKAMSARSGWELLSGLDPTLSGQSSDQAVSSKFFSKVHAHPGCWVLKVQHLKPSVSPLVIKNAKINKKKLIFACPVQWTRSFAQMRYQNHWA